MATRSAAQRKSDKKYQATESAKNRRVKNTRARRLAQRQGWDKPGDGKDVAHLNNNANDNSASNITHQSPSKNRSFDRDANARRAKKKTSGRKKRK